MDKETIDLDISMYPSFASALFIRKDRNEWIKKYGYCKGTSLQVRDGEVSCRGRCCNNSEVVSEWSGAWFNPYRYVNDVEPRLRSYIEKLIECFSDLRLIVSSKDRELILITTFLSRRTDYHRNVVKWVHKLLSFKEHVSNIRDVELRSVSRSYQVKQLGIVLNQLIDVLRRYNSSSNFWRLRYELLKVKYVGPKVVDSFLLFSKFSTYPTPADIHYVRFMQLSRIPIPVRRAIIPSKTQCLRSVANCFNCPLRDKCLTGLSIEYFGRLSGYIQTMAYVIDKALRSLTPSYIIARVSRCYGVLKYTP